MSLLVLFILAFNALHASQPFESDEENLSLWRAGKIYVKDHMLSDFGVAAAIILAPRWFPKTTKACATLATLGYLYCIMGPYDPVASQIFKHFFNSKSQKPQPPRVLMLMALTYHMCRLL